MRPKKHKTTGSNDLFRARLDQIIYMKHELARKRCSAVTFQTMR
jgi:IS5 family transposase